MAELKLSTVWKIEDFAQRKAGSVDKLAESTFSADELPELRHSSFEDYHWCPYLITSSANEDDCQEGFAGFFLDVQFEYFFVSAKHFWASYSATLLDTDGHAAEAYHHGADEFADKECGVDDFTRIRFGNGCPCAFATENIDKATGKDGSLCIRIDLIILNVREIFKCRELLRGILANNTRSDFDVEVGGESFKLHKCVLAGASTVFAGMIDSGMEEAKDDVLTLSDTTAAAFRAFSEAIYYKNWDFLSSVDLTQDVLHLAEKYNVQNLKRYCDDSLSEKINEVNALEILTKSAALCNAEKTKAACVEILSEHMEFKESEMWIAFKKRSRGVALEILDVVSDKLIAVNKRLARERDVANEERDAANAELKRKCEEESTKASSSKRRRK